MWVVALLEEGTYLHLCTVNLERLDTIFLVHLVRYGLHQPRHGNARPGDAPLSSPITAPNISSSAPSLSPAGAAASTSSSPSGSNPLATLAALRASLVPGIINPSLLGLGTLSTSLCPTCPRATANARSAAFSSPGTRTARQLAMTSSDKSFWMISGTADSR